MDASRVFVSASVFSIALLFLLGGGGSVAVDPAALSSGSAPVCENTVKFELPMAMPPGKVGDDSLGVHVIPSSTPAGAGEIPDHFVSSNITACEAWVSVLSRDDNLIPHYGAPLSGEKTSTGNRVVLVAEAKIIDSGKNTLVSETMSLTSGKNHMSLLRVTDETGAIGDCDRFVLENIQVKVLDSSGRELSFDEETNDDCALVLYGTGVYYDLVLPYKGEGIDSVGYSLRQIANELLAGLG